MSYKANGNFTKKKIIENFENNKPIDKYKNKFWSYERLKDDINCVLSSNTATKSCMKKKMSFKSDCDNNICRVPQNLENIKVSGAPEPSITNEEECNNWCLNNQYCKSCIGQKNSNFWHPVTINADEFKPTCSNGSCDPAVSVYKKVETGNYKKMWQESGCSNGFDWEGTNQYLRNNWENGGIDVAAADMNAYCRLTKENKADDDQKQVCGMTDKCKTIEELKEIGNKPCNFYGNLEDSIWNSSIQKFNTKRECKDWCQENAKPGDGCMYVGGEELPRSCGLTKSKPGGILVESKHSTSNASGICKNILEENDITNPSDCKTNCDDKSSCFGWEFGDNKCYHINKNIESTIGSPEGDWNYDDYHAGLKPKTYCENILDKSECQQYTLSYGLDIDNTDHFDTGRRNYGLWAGCQETPDFPKKVWWVDPKVPPSYDNTAFDYTGNKNWKQVCKKCDKFLCSKEDSYYIDTDNYNKNPWKYIGGMQSYDIGTKNYNQCKQFCVDNGGELANKNQILGHIETKEQGDIWTPVSDDTNEWLQIGNRRSSNNTEDYGKLHSEIEAGTIGKPSWSTESTSTQWKKNFYCNISPISVGHSQTSDKCLRYCKDQGGFGNVSSGSWCVCQKCLKCPNGMTKIGDGSKCELPLESRKYKCCNSERDCSYIKSTEARRNATDRASCQAADGIWIPETDTYNDCTLYGNKEMQPCKQDDCNYHKFENTKLNDKTNKYISGFLNLNIQNTDNRNCKNTSSLKEAKDICDKNPNCNSFFRYRPNTPGDNSGKMRTCFGNQIYDKYNFNSNTNSEFIGDTFIKKNPSIKNYDMVRKNVKCNNWENNYIGYSETPAKNDILKPGGIMKVNDILMSTNRKNIFKIEEDGNTTVYINWTGSSGNALWNSNTSCNSNDIYVKFEKDNNLNVYCNGSVLYSSNTSNIGTTGPNSYLIIQNDENLVIYDHDNDAIWSTKGGLINKTHTSVEFPDTYNPNTSGGNINTIHKCAEKCNSNPECKEFYFNSEERNCWLAKGKCNDVISDQIHFRKKIDPPNGYSLKRNSQIGPDACTYPRSSSSNTKYPYKSGSGFPLDGKVTNVGKCSKFCDSVDDCNGFNIKDGICQLCSNTDTVENYNSNSYFKNVIFPSNTNLDGRGGIDRYNSWALSNGFEGNISDCESLCQSQPECKNKQNKCYSKLSNSDNRCYCNVISTCHNKNGCNNASILFETDERGENDSNNENMNLEDAKIIYENDPNIWALEYNPISKGGWAIFRTLKSNGKKPSYKLTGNIYKDRNILNYNDLITLNNRYINDAYLDIAGGGNVNGKEGFDLQTAITPYRDGGNGIFKIISKDGKMGKIQNNDIVYLYNTNLNNYNGGYVAVRKDMKGSDNSGCSENDYKAATLRLSQPDNTCEWKIRIPRDDNPQSILNHSDVIFLSNEENILSEESIYMLSTCNWITENESLGVNVNKQSQVDGGGNDLQWIISRLRNNTNNSNNWVTYIKDGNEDENNLNILNTTNIESKENVKDINIDETIEKNICFSDNCVKVSELVTLNELKDNPLTKTLINFMINQVNHKDPFHVNLQEQPPYTNSDFVNILLDVFEKLKKIEINEIKEKYIFAKNESYIEILQFLKDKKFNINISFDRQNYVELINNLQISDNLLNKTNNYKIKPFDIDNIINIYPYMLYSNPDNFQKRIYLIEFKKNDIIKRLMVLS